MYSFIVRCSDLNSGSITSSTTFYCCLIPYPVPGLLLCMFLQNAKCVCVVSCGGRGLLTDRCHAHSHSSSSQVQVFLET